MSRSFMLKDNLITKSWESPKMFFTDWCWFSWKISMHLCLSIPPTTSTNSPGPWNLMQPQISSLWFAFLELVTPGTPNPNLAITNTQVVTCLITEDYHGPVTIHRPALTNSCPGHSPLVDSCVWNTFVHAFHLDRDQITRKQKWPDSE